MILNFANDGQIEVLWTLAKYLCSTKEHDMNHLKNEFSPGENSKNSKKTTQTITRWTQLGLFVEKEGKLSFSSQFNKINSNNFQEEFSTQLRRLVLDRKNNPKDLFFKQESNLASDFTRAAAWMMMQDPVHFSSNMSTWNDFEYQISIQLKVDDFLNDTRFNQFRRWAVALGFLEGYGSNHFLDPTKAVRSELVSACKKIQNHAVENGLVYPAKNLIKSISENLPVLDGGIYQEYIMTKAKNDMLKFPKPDRVSPMLSLALRRLEMEKIIRLRDRADATSGVILSNDRKVDYIEVEK